MPYAHQSERRIKWLPSLCLLLLIAASSAAVPSESSGQLSPTDITQNVISSLPNSQGQSAEIVARLDLTRPFETQTQWTFVAAILPGAHFSGAEPGPVHGGALAQCFVDNLTAHCTYGTPKNDFDWFSTPIVAGGRKLHRYGGRKLHTAIWELRDPSWSGPCTCGSIGCYYVTTSSRG